LQLCAGTDQSISSNPHKPRNPARVNAVADNNVSDEDAEFALAVHPKGEVKKIQIVVEEQPISFIIDTGSTLNILDEYNFRLIRKNIKLEPYHVNVFGYTGWKILFVVNRT
jgi:hypothetical protein